MTLSADFMRRFGMLLLLASLTACSSLQLRETAAPENAATIEWPVVGAELPSATKWRHHTFPGKRSTHYKLQQIEDLWQQLFALSQSPALNKLYNQYQVQLQVALHSHAAISPQTQARQMMALRQRLIAALTPTP